MGKDQQFVGVIGKKYLTNGQLRFNEPLFQYTTFKIGGSAKIFFIAKNLPELIKAVSLAKKLSLPYFVLGGGSNILVGDLGFKGVVIKNETKKIKILGYKGKIQNGKLKIKNVLLKVESGVLVNRLVRFTLDKGIGGLENFLGLPGTVGGAVYTNAHNLKFEDFFGDHVTAANILTRAGEVKNVSKKYFNFAYDKSKVSQTKEIVLSVIFGLSLGDKRKLWEKANKAMDYRIKTQPIGKFSAGCIFKNIKKSESIRISTPGFTTSAGFLIEAAGVKGKKIGDAQVSPLHANFILNLGRARAIDVVKLIRFIKEKVKEKFGVKLEEEIEMIGDF